MILDLHVLTITNAFISQQEIVVYWEMKNSKDTIIGKAGFFLDKQSTNTIKNIIEYLQEKLDEVNQKTPDDVATKLVGLKLNS